MLENRYPILKKENVKVLAVVLSPLQLINVYALIKKLGFISYSIYIINDEKSSRYMQVVSLAEKFHLNYELKSLNDINYSKWNLVKLFFKSFFCKGICDFLIAGDYRNCHLNIFFIEQMKRNGLCFFVDDGNMSIGTLKGHFEEKKINYIYFFLNIFCMIKRISWKNYYTMYSGLQSPLFNVFYNDSFDSLVNLSLKREVYFIGTVLDVFADVLGLEKKEMECLMTSCLSFVKKKNPNIPIAYIPHGRDNSTFTRQLCHDLGINIIETKQGIEMFCIEHNEVPFTVYAFSSSALFNLKKMNSKINAFSIYPKFKNANKEKIYREIRECYERNGIKFIDFL